MHNYRLQVSYDGSRYKGWQRLGQGESTVQGKIENVLAERLGKAVEVVGSGRTDAGVHALGQVANFRTEESLECAELKTYLNRYLPDDIAVVSVEKAEEDFHARFHAKEQTYLYRIWNEEHPNPFLRKYTLHIEKKLDVARMKKAAKAFVGEHDFTAFANARSKSRSMVRNVYHVEFTEGKGLVEIRVRGDGFLHNMVRIIVGSLADLARGRLGRGAFARAFASGARSDLGMTAPAHGLCLEHVVLDGAPRDVWPPEAAKTPSGGPPHPGVVEPSQRP